MSSDKSAATYLHCPKCKERYDLRQVINLCKCGSPLLVAYDLMLAAQMMPREQLRSRLPTMWKYREVLPVQDDVNVVSLDEGGTPLLPSRRIGTVRRFPGLYFKDESVNPTGSFKARGLAMAVSRAKELGVGRVIIPTAGNAGSALAAYAALAGMKCHIVMPKETPTPFLVDCRYHGATIELVDGTIADCGRVVADKCSREDWFSFATLKEPYRIEGKKTMGYELAEQFEFELPDIIIYPTGGGTGLIGMWKAFAEMETMGWLTGAKPRMISVQCRGCAPIVRAFEQGKASAEPWDNPQTVAAGLRVPAAVGDFLILQAVRESGGAAVAVSEEDMLKATFELASKEGVFAAPEAGAALAAFHNLLEAGYLHGNEKVVVFLTGSGYKYLDTLEKALNSL
ncbi:MAG: threonine synthase [Candidatus Zixiibacteriota bacterium]|nr:MAG: threonine synthase [candidate division Zixibacteria bacterium]